MKNLKFFGIEIEYSFSLRFTKRLTFNLPDWADDVCLTCFEVDETSIKFPSNTTEYPFSFKKGWKIKYYKGSTLYLIDLPKCKNAKKLFITPRINKESMEYNKKRIIIVKIYR